MTFVHAPHEPGTPILDVRNLGVQYAGVAALSDVTLQLRVGERMAVVGPNGAGKSTLLKAAAGLMEPAAGEIQVFGHRPVGHTCIAYLPQRAQVDWNFPVSVRDAVLMGRVGSLGLFRRPGREDRAFALECLHRVGLAELADRQIGELSGGQQQRMFIARALAMRAELVLLDEPFAGLDPGSQRALLDIVDQLARSRVTLMVALHDLRVAAEHFDRILLLNRTVVSVGSPSEVLTDRNILAAYGGHALATREGRGGVMVGDTCGEEGHSHGDAG